MDWTDYNAKLSPNFVVGEALRLNQWGVYHVPSETEKENILAMAQKMELVREFLGNCAINVLCWIRPVVANCSGPMHGRNYNLLVGGAPGSAHISGNAVDFTVSTMTCDDARYHLASELERFDLRMEKKPGSSWIHLGNDFSVGKTRYFKP